MPIELKIKQKFHKHIQPIKNMKPLSHILMHIINYFIYGFNKNVIEWDNNNLNVKSIISRSILNLRVKMCSQH
jgi:hypothetical protein